MKTLLLLTLTSCSLFGINDEKGPKYQVLKSSGSFEIRKYEPYLIAKTIVKGNYDEASNKAFKILAGYIFGKNKGEGKISMTSPVSMNESEEGYTMAFSMPEKYTLDTLPEPMDERIVFKKVPSKLVATHQFSWWTSQARNQEKAQELRSWIETQQVYNASADYTYAGYNPP